MDELEKYQRVNQCETFEELKQCLLDFSDEHGMIKGRSREFEVHKMINFMQLYYEMRDLNVSPNSATRNWGIRGKMMELTYYKK